MKPCMAMAPWKCEWFHQRKLAHQWTPSQLHPDVDQSGIFALHTVDCLLRYANPNSERPVTPELLRYEFATAIADSWPERRLHRHTKEYYFKNERLIKQGWDDRRRSLILADEVLSTISNVTKDQAQVILNTLNSTREFSNRRMAFSGKEDKLHEIEEIVDSRRVQCRLEDRVHWKGYSNTICTWEPLENMAGAWKSIAEFENGGPKEDKPSRGEIEIEIVRDRTVWKEPQRAGIKKLKFREDPDCESLRGQ